MSKTHIYNLSIGLAWPTTLVTRCGNGFSNGWFSILYITKKKQFQTQTHFENLLPVIHMYVGNFSCAYYEVEFERIFLKEGSLKKYYLSSFEICLSALAILLVNLPKHK